MLSSATVLTFALPPSIQIIAPGSETTLAQLGLPESFTPAAVRVRSRMFPAEKEGQWEPYKVRRRAKPASTSNANADTTASTGDGGETAEPKPATTNEEEEDDAVYEEDVISEEGAVWPIVEGKIVNWSCFFGLMSHVYATLNPPFHTPILVISQPSWTPREHEKITQFFFEKFKMPAFALMDSAVATMYAYGVHTATVVDVGKQKCEVTAITEFLAHDTGRAVALKDAGGDAMTQRLMQLLEKKGFNRDMAEQLKKSPICEILPPGTGLPGAGDSTTEAITNPAAAASTGAPGSGTEGAAAIGTVPRGPGPDTEVGDEANGDDDNEGVLDVASIVAKGNMTEFLAKKEKEKAEKTKTKSAAPAAAGDAAGAKAARLPNSKREKNTFLFDDHALLDQLKDMNLSGQKMADAQTLLDEGPKEKTADATNGEAKVTDVTDVPEVSNGMTASQLGPIRREIEVGTERFQAASGGILERIADAVYRTISSVEEVNKRSELWDCVIICGNGARVRGELVLIVSRL